MDWDWTPVRMTQAGIIYTSKMFQVCDCSWTVTLWHIALGRIPLYLGKSDSYLVLAHLIVPHGEFLTGVLCMSASRSAPEMSHYTSMWFLKILGAFSPHRTNQHAIQLKVKEASIVGNTLALCC